MPPHLFPFHFRPDSIFQLQGETRLCLTDNKNLKGGKKKKKRTLDLRAYLELIFVILKKKDGMKRIAVDRQAV